MTLPELSATELLPCPFCGDAHPGVMVNAVQGIYVHYVLCECGARAKEHVGGFEATLAEAIASWNTRNQLVERDAVARVVRCLGFFASVIRSWEPWTDTCEREYRAALTAIKGGGDDAEG